MQVVWTIFHMFPDANNSNVEVVIDTNGNWEITEWGLPVLRPAKADVEAYWNTNQQAILDANKPKKSDLEVLQDTILAIMDLLP